MISTNRLLACLVGLVILAAAGRFYSLAQYYRLVDLHVTDASRPSDLRRLLFLDPDHRVTHFVTVPDLTRPSDEIRPPSCKLAWITIRDKPDDQAGASVRATAILSHDADESFAVDITRLLPESNADAIAMLTPQWLQELPFPTVVSLPSHSLGQTEITVGVWDQAVPVYVTAGPDGAPGIAGTDDDGSGVVDDLGELGATGSDDFVVAPGQPGYEAAAGGQALSRLISRGAIVAARLDQPLVVTGETEVWLDFNRSDSARHRQIMLRLR
ncbi:MAG TPA: hypothetical protein DDZ51_30615 [Planctomycetaceae bacterium]|nr:hypothetical protein [Planctomycetaceae bacterium]